MNQDQVRERLEKFRKELFDFSLKNPLLNYQHPPKRMIRFVDGVSNLIYGKLREGDGRLVIKPFVGKWEKGHFDLDETNLVNKFFRSADYREQLFSPVPPDQLEKTLANLAKTAKSLMAESGVNTLYLVFGFLEWCDAAEPDTPRFAPILMAPVELRREKLDAKTGSTIYSIEFSEEGAEVNPTLREWLQRNPKLRMPEFSTLDDDDTPEQNSKNLPEQYFKNLKELIQPFPGWQVRNQLTLALLSVNSILMYKDLDAAENPAILQRRFIQHLVGGAREDGPLQFSDYSIDDPEIDRDLPPLIYDADSSQHSALIDAMRGRNLVIEGPPGTGKSQTITNLIAAALASGKKVLFVAEKEAALEVVHNRLDQCGLSSFCLELHSHKTQTGALSESLKRRMELKVPALESDSPPDRKTSLNNNKRRLTAYVETINRSYGKCGQTIHQAIWRRQRLRQDFTFNASSIEPIPLPDAQSLSFEQVEHLKQSAEIYGQHLSQVLKKGSLKQHPWHGVANWQISVATEREIVMALQAIANISNQVQKQIDDLNQECGRKLLSGEPSLRELILARDALPAVPLNLIAEMLPQLNDRKNRQKLYRICEWLDDYRQIREQTDRCFSQNPDLNSGELTILRAYCREVRDMDIDWRTPDELKGYIGEIEGHAADLSRISSWFRQICSILNCPLPFSTQTVLLAVKTADIFDEIPWQAIHLRAPELETDGVVPVASQAYNEAEKLQKQEKSISKRLDLNLRPSREQLVQYLEALADAGFLSFTKRDFLLARRAWRRMNKRGQKASHQEMAREFRELIHLGDKQNEFISNAQYRKVLGNLFNGLQTPLAQLLSLSVWYLAVKRKLGFASDAGQQITSSLFNVPAANLQALYEFLHTDKMDREEVRAVFDDYDPFVATLPPQLQQEAKGDLDSFAMRLRELAAHLGQIVLLFEECHVKPDTPICQIPELLDSLHHTIELRNHIVNDREAAQLLNVKSISIEMDTQGVTVTLDFVEGLERSALPAAIIPWLMTQDIRSRVASLRSFLTAIEMSYARFLQSKETFARLTRINDIEGFFHDVSASSRTFGQITKKAEQAILATAELATWLSYLRARQEAIELGLG